MRNHNRRMHGDMHLRGILNYHSLPTLRRHRKKQPHLKDERVFRTHFTSQKR